MGKYLLSDISLKSIKQPTWEEAFNELKKIVADEFRRNEKHIHFDSLYEFDKKVYESFCNQECEDKEYNSSLKELSSLLFRSQQQQDNCTH